MNNYEFIKHRHRIIGIKYFCPCGCGFAAVISLSHTPRRGYAVWDGNVDDPTCRDLPVSDCGSKWRIQRGKFVRTNGLVNPGDFRYNYRGNKIVGLSYLCPCGCGDIGAVPFTDSYYAWNGDVNHPTCWPSMQFVGEGCGTSWALQRGKFVPFDDNFKFQWPEPEIT